MADRNLPSYSPSAHAANAIGRGGLSFPNQLAFGKHSTAVGLVVLILSVLLVERLWSSPPASKSLGLVEYFRRRRKAWSFLLHGQKIIDEGYVQSGGGPFEVLAPEGRYVFISSPKHVDEMDAAPEDVLSVMKAAKSVRQPLPLCSPPLEVRHTLADETRYRSSNPSTP